MSDPEPITFQRFNKFLYGSQENDWRYDSATEFHLKLGFNEHDYVFNEDLTEATYKQTSFHHFIKIVGEQQGEFETGTKEVPGLETKIYQRCIPTDYCEAEPENRFKWVETGDTIR